MFRELCSESKLVMYPVSTEYDTTFVAAFGLFQPARFLNAEVKQRAEVRVDSSAV